MVDLASENQLKMVRYVGNHVTMIAKNYEIDGVMNALNKETKL